MSLNVFTNVSSLNAQRHLGKVSSNLQTSFERLSSGLRINSAKDDAAGLAISERMDAQIRGMDQARRNTADGISLVQTVESGLGEVNSILQRLRELAVQSASDSNTTTDRVTLDNEATQLIASLDQIASSTEFNGMKVLDGTTGSFTFQTGANNQADQRLSVSLGGVRAGQLGGLARSTTAAVDGTDLSGTNLSINGTAIVASTSYGSDVGHVATVNEQNDSAYAKAKAINASNVGVKANANSTVDTNTFSATSTAYTLSINNVVIFQSSQASSVEDMVSRINAQSEATGVIATNTGSSYSLTAADGRNINLNVSAGAAIQGLGAGAEQVRGTMTLSSESNITVNSGGATIGLAGSAAIAVDASNLNTNVNLQTRSGSLEAIDRIDSAIKRVITLRGRMGAVQNRLEATSSNLASISENLSSARARIRDADFAWETAALTRNQVLQQAASAMLAQANQAPQQALQLLRQ